jgi:hypothetical protein
VRNLTVLAGAAVLLTAACGSSAASTPEGAVVGRVLSAPSCPVEQQGVPCPPRPVPGAAVVALQDGQSVASTTTGKRGYFQLVLDVGRYRLRATNVGAYASTASKFVTVKADGTVFVRLIVDSGIR